MTTEYTKGTGTEEKPQGEAKKLNDSMQPVQQDAAPVPAPAAPVDNGPPIPLKAPEPLAPPGGEDAMLYGKTSRANEPVNTQRNRAEVPAYIFEALPAIVRAAQMPDASPALKALVRLLDSHVNGA